MNIRDLCRVAASVTAAATALLSMTLSGPAQACSTCLCGDPTLTQFGTEKPYAGRTRASLEWLSRGENFGEKGVDRREIDESRVTLGISYAYNERWLVGARLPYVRKSFDDFNLASQHASGVGDLELSAKWFLQPDEGIARHDTWGLQFGVRTPTAQRQKSGGQVLDFDVQPGTRSWGGSLGGFYGHYAAPWFFYTSAAVQATKRSTIGAEPFTPGTALAFTGIAQYALNPGVSLKLGIDGRVSKQDKEDDVRDPDSGGFFAFASPGIVWMPAEDLLFDLAVQIPALNQLHGEHDETTTVRIGVTYDF